MTPDHFTASTLAWLLAIVTILNAPVTAVLWAKIASMRNRLDRHGETFKDVNAEIIDLNRALPSPSTPNTPATAPQAPVTASAGFQGIAATPAMPPTNMGDIDRNDLLARIDGIRQSVAAADGDVSPGPAMSAVEGNAPAPAPPTV